MADNASPFQPRPTDLPGHPGDGYSGGGNDGDLAPDTSTDEALFDTARRWFKLDAEHSREWREEAKEDFQFVAGNQWTDEDKRILREQLRPETTFNRIDPVTSSVVGLEIGNRREVQFYPRSVGDSKPDEVLSAAAEWSREQCDAEDEETDAFSDCVICGMGWVDTRMAYDQDPQGMILEERIDPFEMYWDADALKRNLVDARRTWRVKTMPIEDARLLAPDADDSELDASWARVDGGAREPHDADPQVAYRQGNQYGDVIDNSQLEEDEVTIVHLQWWEREPRWRIAMDGDVKSLTDAEYRTLMQRMRQAMVAGAPVPPMPPAVRQMAKVFKQALIGAVVLTQGPGACEDHFTWQCITGKRDQVRRYWYGLVRAMKDPQRWANKWLSQTMHILNSNAKGGLFAERGAFDNDRQAEDSYARSDRITWMKSGAIAAGRIQEKTSASFPTGFSDLMQFAISSIRDVSGVNVELLGMAATDQAATLEDSRKQSGMNILAWFFDSLRRFRKIQGRILLYFIQNYISDGRLIRIVGQEGAQYVPLIHQPGMAQYDVIVDEDATSPNQKEKVWGTLMMMMPMIGSKLDASDWSLLMKYSPLPASLVEEWQTQQQQQQAQQQPIQQAMQQLQVQLASMEVQLKQAQANQANATAAMNAAKAGGAQGGTDAADAQNDYMATMQDGQLQQAKMAQEGKLQAAKIMSEHLLGEQRIAAENQRAAQNVAAKNAATQTQADWHRDQVQTDLHNAAADRAMDVANAVAKRRQDAATEAGWMMTDRATKAHSDAMNAAARLRAAEITARNRPRAPGPRAE
jgi:hypothetical protein